MAWLGAWPGRGVAWLGAWPGRGLADLLSRPGLGTPNLSAPQPDLLPLFGRMELAQPGFYSVGGAGWRRGLLKCWGALENLGNRPCMLRADHSLGSSSRWAGRSQRKLSPGAGGGAGRGGRHPLILRPPTCSLEPSFPQSRWEAQVSGRRSRGQGRAELGVHGGRSVTALPPRPE